MNNNYIKVYVEGKNVNNYIKWLIKQNINIINLNLINYNSLKLVIYYHDYQKLFKYSKTYKIKIIKKYGFIKIIDNIKKNSFIIIPLFIAILFLYFLSNIIFSIDIVYNDQQIVEQLIKELKKYNIDKYKFKKNYLYLKEVKEQILNDNKDTLEWLEIEEEGTKYIVKLVERKKPVQVEEYEYQSISATKDAIITSIKASSGEKIKEVNDYVKKDDVIVSGTLTKSDGTIVYTKAKAIIYGEVWYKVNIEYPYAYTEEKVTGKSKEVFVINFLNNKIPILPYKKYKKFKITTDNIIENNILPLSLSKEKLYEVLIKEEIYTLDEVISNAIEVSKEKMLKSNSKIINIKKVDILEQETIGSKIKLKLFISTEEDITKIVEVKKRKHRFTTK